MKLREILLWQPGVLAQAWIFLSTMTLVLGVGYLHKLTGLAYEFHVFFILPVLLAAWFVGARSGYALALLAGAVWFIADRMLEGEQADALSLLFNTGMRLAIFMFGAWLMAALRRILARVLRWRGAWRRATIRWRNCRCRSINPC